MKYLKLRIGPIFVFRPKQSAECLTGVFYPNLLHVSSENIIFYCWKKLLLIEFLRIGDSDFQRSNKKFQVFITVVINLLKALR